MPWTIAFLEAKTGAIRLYTEGMHVSEDDPEYHRDVHFVPMTPLDDNNDDFVFGYHELTRDCCCHPRVKNRGAGRTHIVHSERVN